MIFSIQTVATSRLAYYNYNDMPHLPTHKVLLKLAKSAAKKIDLNTPSNLSKIDFEKIDENLTPNMRALRLTMSIADQLFSMGVAASDVVHSALAITNTYCKRPVHIDISYTLLTISQDRGINKEPLTMIRTITTRTTNYQTIQSLQELAKMIRSRQITLSDAEKQLKKILESSKSYSRWMVYLSDGGIGAGISILYTGSIPIIVLSFFIGFLTSWILDKLDRIGVPSFFIQVIAAAGVTVIAAVLTNFINNYEALDIISYINPTLIAISGIVLLVAGMMIVGALQDAIDEYYLTATARILKVIMKTGGIVLGVTIGLYIAKKMNTNFATTPDGLALTSITYQYIGAAITAACFALGNHSRLTGIILSGVVGVAGYYCSIVFINNGMEAIPASGIAACAVGLSSTVISRIWRIPSVATISAGIIPLVPGITLYNGLMQVVQNSPGTALFDQGMGTLLRAFMIAITIAAGASFGNIIGRPMRRKLIKLHNKLPSLSNLSIHKQNKS